MSGESEEGEVLLTALGYLALPEEAGSIYTVADLPDMRTIILASALFSLAEKLNDKSLETFTRKLLALTRSRKRKGAKELIELFKAARTRTQVTTLVTRAKRILVGEHGAETVE